MAEQVADWLRAEIRAGRLREVLPPCRELADRLGTSPPTVVGALAMLLDEGWVVAGGSRRPYRVAARKVRRSEPRQRLLLLSPEPISACASYTREVAEQTLLDCTRHGWETQTQVLDYRNAKSPARRWDELVRVFRPTRIIAVTGTPVLAQWALRLRLPVLFLGGSPGETTVTTVGVSLSASLRQLLRLLPDGDCLHSCLPVCGYPEVFATAIHRVYREELEARGMTFVPGYHAPYRAAPGPDEIRAALRPVFARRVPQCLIFNTIQDYLAALGMIQKHVLTGGRPPTLAFLSHDELHAWMSPRPIRFIYPLARLWALVRSWLANPEAARFNRGYILLDAIHQPAEGDA